MHISFSYHIKSQTIWFPDKPSNRDNLLRCGSRTCLVFRSFLTTGCCLELAGCFLLYQYGNFRIWLKFWYFVLFLFLFLTLGLLYLLSLSASIDPSWPIGSVNPFHTTHVWLCQCSILLGFVVNPHGSVSWCLHCYPASLFPQPSWEPGLSTDLEERQCIRLSSAFSCAHGHS